MSFKYHANSRVIFKPAFQASHKSACVSLAITAFREFPDVGVCPLAWLYGAKDLFQGVIDDGYFVLGKTEVLVDIVVKIVVDILLIAVQRKGLGRVC